MSIVSAEAIHNVTVDTRHIDKKLPCRSDVSYTDQTPCGSLVYNITAGRVLYIIYISSQGWIMWIAAVKYIECIRLIC